MQNADRVAADRCIHWIEKLHQSGKLQNELAFCGHGSVDPRMKAGLGSINASRVMPAIFAAFAKVELCASFNFDDLDSVKLDAIFEKRERHSRSIILRALASP